MNFTTRFRTLLPKTAAFVIVPLLLELLAYLIRGDIFPKYLSIPVQFRDIGLVFLYYALLYAGASLIATVFFALIPIKVEWALPSLFFTAFLALTLSRLLPQDSGLSPARVIVFAISFILGVALFFFLKKRKFPVTRLFFASCIYSLTAAHLLPHLFQFPVANVFYALLTHVVLISVLLMVPGKILIAVLVFGVIILFQRKITVEHFAAPGKIPSYERVVLVGIDGMSPDLAFDLARQGKMPAVRKMMENGTYGRLHTLTVPFSPLVWNTIYTGTEPEQHGIMAFTFTGIAGGNPFLSLWLDNWTNSDWMHRATMILKKGSAVSTLYPALSKNRLRPAVWNIVNQNNAAAVVLGGWTTYPPEKIVGTYISDYALTRNTNLLGSYYPVSKVVDGLLSYQPEVSSWPADLQKYVSKDAKTHYLWKNLSSFLTSNTRLISSYYYSTDAFGHHYGTYIDRSSTTAADRSKDLDLREKVYRNIDHYLQEYIDSLDDRTLLIVCSDHGFHFDKRQHNYPVDGIILMMGKGVRKQTSIQASVYSIAPTITYALGIAPERSFRDTPLRQAFEGILPEIPPKEYKSNKEFFEISVDKGFEKEKLQELLDLQYINK